MTINFFLSWVPFKFLSFILIPFCFHFSTITPTRSLFFLIPEPSYLTFHSPNWGKWLSFLVRNSLITFPMHFLSFCLGLFSNFLLHPSTPYILPHISLFKSAFFSAFTGCPPPLFLFAECRYFLYLRTFPISIEFLPRTS